MISTCAGAWRYLIGDVIEFTNAKNAEIKIETIDKAVENWSKNFDLIYGGYNLNISPDIFNSRERVMNVLSLFDGMSCTQIALKNLGIKVDNYYASEIDKYAIEVARKNFPETIHLGDIKDIHESIAFAKGVEWFTEIFFFYGVLFLITWYELKKSIDASASTKK